MDNILLIIIILGIMEIYFLTIAIFSIFEMHYYRKDGNKKGTNLKGRILRNAINHELVHARIANMFGFMDWKIIPKIDSLACRIEINYDVLTWKTLFRFLKMCIFHLIFDIGVGIIWVNVISICEHIKQCFLDIKIIINRFIKIKKLNMMR